jgi:hypothetical protein
MKIENSRDFVGFVTETMQGVRDGEISPAAGNAVANLSGKIVQMISLEMKVMDYPKLAHRNPLQIEAGKNEKKK